MDDRAAMSVELDQFISKWKELEAMLMTVDFGDKKDEVMRRWNELGSTVISWKAKMGGSDMGSVPTGGSIPPSMPPTTGGSMPGSIPPSGGSTPAGGITPPPGGMPPPPTGM